MLQVSVRVRAALVAALWLAGSLALDARAADLEIRLRHGDHGTSVDLDENHVLSLELPANFSTGYLWEVVEANGDVVTRLPNESFAPDSHRVGAPGVHTLRFGAVGAGATRITLAYRQPWETGVPPLSTMTVHVRASGRFTGKHRAAANAARAMRLAADPTLSPSAFSWNPIDWVRDYVDDVVANGEDLIHLVDQAKVIMEFPPVPLPSRFNWCELGKCTPVRHQGACGSCWAFATVGVFESQILIRDGFAKDLSEQYLISCNQEGWNCAGGWEAHAYHSWKTPTGEPGPGAVYESETGYPDSSRPVNGGRAECTPPHTHRERLGTFGTASGLPADLIKRIIVSSGPVTATVCTGPAFDFYPGGVFSTTEDCGSARTSHMVVLVGWDDAEGVWHLRNSWGASWGESGTPWSGNAKGYMRIKYGTSNIADRVSYIKYAGSPMKVWNLVPLLQSMGE